MSSEEEPKQRPKIRDILSEEELKGMAPGAGMSAEQVAKVMGPLSKMSKEAYQAQVAAGAAIGKSLGFAAAKSAETLLACSYPAAVRGLVLALTSYVEVEMPGDFFSHTGTL